MKRLLCCVVRCDVMFDMLFLLKFVRRISVVFSGMFLSLGVDVGFVY